MFLKKLETTDKKPSKLNASAGYENKAKRSAKQLWSDVINALASLYCYFLRAEVKGYQKREKSYSGQLLTAPDRSKKSINK